jgi:hypothetical protein
MKILFWSLVAFCTPFLIHLVVWRISLPRRQTRVLQYLFFGALFIMLPAIWGALSFIPHLWYFVPVSVAECLHIFILSTSLILAYVITYSAIEADSPSLLIVREIADAGPEGLSEEKLKAALTNDFLIAPRLRDLIVDKMVYVQRDKYCLTFKGFLIAKIFVLSRKLLNAPKGG